MAITSTTDTELGMRFPAGSPARRQSTTRYKDGVRTLRRGSSRLRSPRRHATPTHWLRDAPCHEVQALLTQLGRITCVGLHGMFVI
jgi:hypothetical protein